jgi:hypothetical protein
MKPPIVTSPRREAGTHTFKSPRRTGSLTSATSANDGRSNYALAW